MKCLSPYKLFLSSKHSSGPTVVLSGAATEMVLTSTAFRNAVSIFISYIIIFLKAGIAKIIRIDDVADTVVYIPMSIAVGDKTSLKFNNFVSVL